MNKQIYLTKKINSTDSGPRERWYKTININTGNSCTEKYILVVSPVIKDTRTYVLKQDITKTLNSIT